MADKKDNKKAAAPAKKGGRLGFITLVIIFGFMSPFIVPTLTVFVLGMLPTVVALISDSDRQKSSAIAIGSMNFAGVVPFIIDLWVKGQTMPHAFHILSTPANWLVMLGAAGIGQLIVYVLPPALASLTTIRMEVRTKALKQNLETLKATWGPEVGTTTPISKLTNKE